MRNFTRPHYISSNNLYFCKNINPIIFKKSRRFDAFVLEILYFIAYYALLYKGIYCGKFLRYGFIKRKMGLLKILHQLGSINVSMIMIIDSFEDVYLHATFQIIN